MQHPSGYLIWQYVSSGLILWGRSSLLPKQDAFSLLLCSRMILSLWNSWTWDFLLVLRRPIETAALLGQVNRCFRSRSRIWNFLPDYGLLHPRQSVPNCLFQDGPT